MKIKRKEDPASMGRLGNDGTALLRVPVRLNGRPIHTLVDMVATHSPGGGGELSARAGGSPASNRGSQHAHVWVHTDRPKTAFTAPDGRRLQFCVMLFGLMNAPAMFQAMMFRVLDGFDGKFVTAYLDDVII
ncbi:uncharacterized protein LOC134539887 [Bacillus rossius redtenbacheri]|uniref:uncharacterized protein LOC134539887 n=1 Tax=Bacillus rossius redtenbacheri TaxID=93214 RepID=UPI002FDD2D39